MQTVECSIGQSFLVEHADGKAKVTVVSIMGNQVTLGIEDSSVNRGLYREVTVAAKDNALLELLRSRGRS